MKRIVTTLLLLMLLLPQAVLAASPVDDRTTLDAELRQSVLDTQLRQLGYPEDVIPTLEPAVKEVLVSEQAVFVGFAESSEFLGDEEDDMTIQGVFDNYTVSVK